MTDSDDSLAEWNRLNKANAENALVSAMFRGLLSATYTLDRYSNWLSAGVGAGAVLLIGNADSLLQVLDIAAYKACLVAALTSLGFGAASKFLAVMCQSSEQSQSKVEEASERIFSRFFSEQAQIDELAVLQNRTLVTDFSIANVVRKFLAPFPHWQQWLMSEWIARHAKDPHVAYLLPARLLRWQSGALTLQLLSLVVAVATFVAGVKAL